MENGKIIAWRYEICNVGGQWVEEQTPHKPDEEMFAVRNVLPVYAQEEAKL
ncbi:hypothetical protein [Serratia sp. JSRIV004]|uniref:hypothetical protein n=1 Tax=Serratia sp. JSRIV004 TaxID=2831895 RepID=UPI001CBE8398|nr:hypothetical protein [Serratia sp. JSRIV004]UAN58973.1 hypothetical protein KGP21_07975 [Serratia sp. JSRIV004]UAN59602.1 hypothetical protein KGP21_11360 [Serratia sp. JSRIV004]